MLKKSWIMKTVFCALALIVLPARVLCDAAFDKLIAEKKYQEALDYADEKIPASDRDGKIWAELAKANDALGMTEKALACYLVSWRMNSEDYQSLLGAAQVYNKLEQHDNAANMAQKALELKFTAQASWEYARACIALGKPADAKKALEKVIEEDSSNMIANRELGNIYYDEGSYTKAVPLIKRAYKEKADGEVAFKLGKSYVEIGVADSALVYLEKAVAQNAKISESSLYIARAQFGLKKYADAIEGFKKVSKDQMTAMDHYMVAVSKEKTKDKAGAIEDYQKAIDAFGDETKKEALLAREKAARAHMEKQAFSKALPLLQFVVKADEKGKVVSDIYFLLADAHQGMDNAKEAISSLEKAISLDSKNIEAYARLADLYEKNGQSEKAKSTFETMMSLDPKNPDVFLSLGQYNLKAERYDEALKHFQKSNSLRKSAAASEGMAIAYHNQENIAKAQEMAKAAIALNPNIWQARVILAHTLINNENYKDAQEQAEFLAEKEPENVEYLSMLATCYDKNGVEDKLAETDKKIVELDRKNVESRLRLARYADKKEDVETAYKMYKEVSLLDPKNEASFRRLAELSREKGEKTDAISYLEKYLKLSPKDAVAQRDLGDLLYEQKKLDAALKCYRAAIKIDPNLKGFHKRYAEIVIAKGQTDEVIKALSTLIENDEADFGTYTTLGMIYQKRKQHEKAIDMYSKALQLDPQNLDALTALGTSQAESGDLNSAIISYEQAVMMNPEAGKEFKDLGDLYTRQEKNAEAIKAYMKYLDKVPTDKKVAKKIGKTLFEEKRYKEAAKYMKMAQSEDAEYLVMYSEACLRSDKTKEAISTLEELRERKKLSNRKDVLKILAEAYEKTEDRKNAAATYADYIGIKGVKDAQAAYKAGTLYEEIDTAKAIDIYSMNIRNYPDDFRNRLRLGLLYSQNEETLSKALPLLKKCTGIADSLPKVWLELARVYGKMRKTDKELEAYQNFAKSDPQHPEANKKIGLLLMGKGDYTNAMVHLEIANTVAPDDPQIMTYLARGYERTDRMDEAISLLEKAKKAQPEDGDIRFQLFRLYEKAGQTKKAQKEIKQLVELKEDNRYLMLYGKALIEQKKVKEAQKVVDQILEEDPENIDALMLKGEVQRAKKKWDEARETYRFIYTMIPDYAPAFHETAEVYMYSSRPKPSFAKAFYKRALMKDSTYAPAHLGLARHAKKWEKDEKKYMEHLEKAAKLAPDNEEIAGELKRAKK
ncbi:MAG: tetratricopeptide repeat protein [Chitinispirillaceae bacterium]